MLMLYLVCLLVHVPCDGHDRLVGTENVDIRVHVGTIDNVGMRDKQLVFRQVDCSRPDIPWNLLRWI